MSSHPLSQKRGVIMNMIGKAVLLAHPRSGKKFNVHGNLFEQ